MRKIKLICFDVDGTLVEGNSWLTLTRGLGCSVKKHLDILKRAQTGKITFHKAERLLIRLYWDSDKANKENINNIFFQVKPRKEAFGIIDYLKQKGCIIYLISGAIDIYVKRIADNLGVDGFFSNSKLEFDNNGLLTKIHYREEQGKIKLEQLKELSEKNEIDIKEIAFIGDSENDLEVFKATGNGIATLPANNDLVRVAWKTVNSLTAIKNIL